MLLLGCTLIPEYERPKAPVEVNWPQGEAYEAAPYKNDLKVSEIGWKKFFKSSALCHLIQTALDNNRDLKVAALNVEAAQAAYRIQRADFLPTIDISAKINRERIPRNASQTGKATTAATYTASVGTTAFELDLFGKIRSLNEQALEEYFSKEEAKASTLISLIAEVANAYIAYQGDRKLLSLTRDTFFTQQKSYEIVEKSYKSGIASKLDLAQAASALETARTKQIEYSRQVAQDKNALILLVGASISDEILQAETIDTINVMQDLPVGLPSKVLLDRPDIRAAEHLLKAANANIGAARAAFFPSLELTSSIGLSSQSLNKLFSNGSGLAWSFVPNLSLPIFTAGRHMANLDSAEISKKIEIAQYEKTIQNAFEEVANALAARATYTHQLTAQKESVAANQSYYYLTQQRYKKGIDSYTAVLNAEQSFYNSQENEIILQQSRLSNLVNLYKALGGGMHA